MIPVELRTTLRPNSFTGNFPVAHEYVSPTNCTVVTIPAVRAPVFIVSVNTLLAVDAELNICVPITAPIVDGAGLLATTLAGFPGDNRDKAPFVILSTIVIYLYAK